MEIVAERLGSTVEATLESFGYDLADKFGTLYAAFEACAASADALEEAEVEGDWTKVFTEVAKENVTPPYVQISGYLELRMPHGRWRGQDKGSAPRRTGGRARTGSRCNTSALRSTVSCSPRRITRPQKKR